MTASDTAGLPPGYVLRPELELTARQVKGMLDAGTPRVLIVDVRTQPEWDAVHLKGAVHIPLDEVERRADEIELNPGQTLAVICHHGVRSLKASLALRALGFPAAMSIAGGMDAWSLGADPTVARYERGPGGVRLLA